MPLDNTRQRKPADVYLLAATLRLGPNLLLNPAPLRFDKRVFPATMSPTQPPKSKFRGSQSSYACGVGTCIISAGAESMSMMPMTAARMAPSLWLAENRP